TRQFAPGTSDPQPGPRRRGRSTGPAVRATAYAGADHLTHVRSLLLPRRHVPADQSPSDRTARPIFPAGIVIVVWGALPHFLPPPGMVVDPGSLPDQAT